MGSRRVFKSIVAPVASAVILVVAIELLLPISLVGAAGGLAMAVALGLLAVTSITD